MDKYEDEFNKLIIRLNNIDELAGLHDFLDDEELEAATEKALNVYAKPWVPKEKAAALVNMYQSIAMICSQKFLYYVYVVQPKSGTLEYRKKNVYKLLKEDFQEAAHSMKKLSDV